jgi:hypothetical protein
MARIRQPWKRLQRDHRPAGVSPERCVSGRQLWDHVMKAIEQLPSGQRAVLVLCDMNPRVLLRRDRGRIRRQVCNGDAYTL